MQYADSQVRHVVMLILENHSFDQLLGCFKQIYPQMEGVDPAAPGINRDSDGTVYAQHEVTQRQVLVDPRHELAHVMVQLSDNNGGFVRDFSESFPDSTPEHRAFVMGYYPLDFLPALHALARNYTLCDHWFASVPGPTWPNRFFALSGTSCGRVTMPSERQHRADVPGWFAQQQPTLFDRLTERNINWKVYFNDVPQSAVLCRQRLACNAARYFYMEQFYRDALGRADDFPAFSLVEPVYKGSEENDDHPPHDVMKAQRLLADIYNALRSNPELWASTLLVVYYDEHGGFYDHVPPPAAAPPDDQQHEFSFDRLGVRVPALLISPWVDQRLEQQTFCHASVLKYLTEKWNLGPLGERVRTSASIAPTLTRTTPRLDVLPRIDLTPDQLRVPDPILEEQANQMVTEHHESLQSLVTLMAGEALTEAPSFFSGFSRGLEAVQTKAQAIIHGVLPHHAGLHVSIVRPDHVVHERAHFQEDFGHYLKHLKLRALPELAKRISNQELPRPVRHHAVATLSMITGNRFQDAPNPIKAATDWLSGHGVS